jgi:hypothetical protein
LILTQKKATATASPLITGNATANTCLPGPRSTVAKKQVDRAVVVIDGMTAKSWPSEEMTVLSRATQALFQKKWFVAATAHPGSAPGNQSM